VRPGADHLLAMTLEGDAYVRIWLEEYRGGSIVSNELAGDMPLTPEAGPRTYVRRFRPSCGVTAIRVAVDHRGRSWLRVADAALHEVASGPALPVDADGCGTGTGRR